MKNSYLIILLGSLLFASCSTIEYAQNPIILKGKTVGVVPFEVSGVKKKKQLSSKDSVCFCIGQSVSDGLNPFLMNAGLTATPLYHDFKATKEEALIKADSLHLDYILMGRGLVSIVGSSNFIQSLNIKMINVKTGREDMVVAFSATTIRANKVATKIGKKIMNKLM